MMIGIKWASAWYNGVMVPGKESCEPLMVYELFTYWMLSMMRSLSYMHQAIIQLSVPYSSTVESPVSFP